MKKAKNRMNKKLQSHVEMMISFIIFVGAIIFILMFINPLKEKRQDNSVEDIQRTILKNVSSDIWELSVIVNTTDDCYNVPVYGNKFVEIKESDSDRKYTLYYNLNDNPAVPSCVAKVPRNFSFGAYSKENFIIYENLVLLAGYYTSDYQKLKDSLGIAKDFSFSFKEIGGNAVNEISVLKNIPKGVDVNAKEFPVRVMDRNANIRNLILSIREW